MLTDIYYRDITRTDYLEPYLLDKIEGLVEKFMHDDLNAHLIVRVETERHRTQNRKPLFICEVVLKPTHSKKILKVRKSGDDFHKCVGEINDALKKVLQKMSSKRVSQKRRRVANPPAMDLDVDMEGSDIENRESIYAS